VKERPKKRWRVREGAPQRGATREEEGVMR